MERACSFVECKTKRLRLEAKSDIRTESAFERELEKLAEFISQVYRTIADYKAGVYPNCAHQNGKEVFPIVVTLEEWHVFGPKSHASLEERVRRRLLEDKLPAEWAGEMPYSICSVNEFEHVIQVIEGRGIAEVMRRKAGHSEFRQWEMHGFLRQEFREEFNGRRELFPEVLDELVPFDLRDDSARST